MLSLPHSYAHQHVRNALNDETHHIKVSDETGGEVYDVTLNSTEPFATPRVSTPVSNPESSNGQSANNINRKKEPRKSRGAAAIGGSSSPPLVAPQPSSPTLSNNATSSSPPALRPLQLVSKVKSDHSRSNSNGVVLPRSSSPINNLTSNLKSTNINNSDSQQPQQYTAPTRRHPFLSSELPPSPPLEPDMEMQYRNANGMSGETDSGGDRQGYLGTQDREASSSMQRMKGAEKDISDSTSRPNGDSSIPSYPKGGAIGPVSSSSSPAPSSSLNLLGHLQKDTSESSSSSNNLKRPSAANRRNMSSSAASTNTTGTAYATASEDEGEDEIGGPEKQVQPSVKSPQSTYMTAYQIPTSIQSPTSQPQPSVLLVPTTEEPASFLHQPQSSIESNSPSLSQPQRIQPSRRATTGSPRPPSTSSVNTQRSSRELNGDQLSLRQKSKERSNSTGPGLFGNAVPAAAAALGFGGAGGPPASFYEEHGNQSSNIPALNASNSRTHLEKTGDADFDEDWLKNVELKKRERQYKRQKEAEAVAQAQAQLQQQPVGLLSGRGKADAQGVEAPGANAGAALSHVETRGEDGTGDPKVIKGKLIGEDHVNYVLMYNMLTGIRIGVSRCQAKPKRALTDADYTARHKFTFDIIGNELTPSAKYDFKFKDYAPWVFRELRECFQLDPADYLLSLTAKYILSELGSPGKSGSFFYFSRDYRFIIKTIRHGEHKFFLKILKDYHAHVKANPHTLLSRFYGLHRVKLPRGRKIHFVIMNNLFPPHRDIHETYDLKGSAIGREYPEDLVEKKKGAAVMKDLNWLNRNREIELGPEKRTLFEHQLKKDVELLQRLNIMDYSLLIGLHDMSKGNSQNLRQDKLQVFQPGTSSGVDSTNPSLPGLKRMPTQKGKRISEADALALRQAIQSSDPKSLSESGGTRLPDRDVSERRHFIFYQDEGGIRSTDENNNPTGWLYYLNVIDLFTPYNSVKRAEHYWKGLTNDSRMISSVHPIQYGNRFYNFLMSVVTGGDKSKRPKMK